MLAAKLLCGVGEEKLYVDDVFSAYTYTGNGSTQTINNGIDLAGKGGLVWVKDRSQSAQHSLFDTARGVGNVLSSNTTNAQAAGYPYTVQSTGFTANHGQINTNAVTYVSHTFRKAPKFFDVVTWTGNSTPRTIAHSLGSAPGMIMVKKTNTADSWYVYHRSLGNGGVLYLEQTAAAGTGSSYWNSTDPTASVFSVGGNTGVNGTGNTYVAYLFAHDTSTDGLIQCGSFTTDGSGNATVSLGWEPQYLLCKKSSGVSDWYVFDNSRNWAVGSAAITPTLSPNTTYAEYSSAPGAGYPTATGFKFTYEASQTYIYLAIRRSNKPPTVGTQVYQAVSRAGTAAVAEVTGLGFAPDLALAWRSVGGFSKPIQDRLRGANRQSYTHATDPEVGIPNELNSFNMDGVTLGTGASVGWWNTAGGSYINHFFKRAIGVFDVVCYTGSGSNKTEAHNLGVAPELWLMKGRSGTLSWRVGCTALSNTEYLILESTAAKATDATAWNSTYPTSTVFSLGTQTIVNTNMGTFLAYLFATKAGISKVGSYTGTGTTKQVDCGFTTGARFVVIKRTDSTGAWYVWDTVRGIIAGNDPFSLLNSTAAEDASTDYIDPYTSGFELSSTAPAAINASGGTFIYLAFA